jgi:NADPH:quinone reductase-like Zn-dependent oxidoreductase
MKAAIYTRYGPPEVVRIGNIEKPVPKDNEVLVRVHATTVCAADWRVRKADPFIIRFMNGISKPSKMQVLGMEFAGIVEVTGAAVTRFRPGDAVFGGTGFKLGAHAEYVCLPEDGSLAGKPANMTFEQAATVWFGGITALHFLRLAKIQPGQRVLVYGASGSVGTSAVQLAKHFGAHVTGVCSTGNLELVKSLGADEAIDYTKEDFSKTGRTWDTIFDAVGKSGFRRSLGVLRRGGAYIQVGLPGRSFLTSVLGSLAGGAWTSLTGSAKSLSGGARREPGDEAFFKELIEAGKLKAVIDRRYSFDEIVEAHRYAEAGHKKGNVVVVLEPSLHVDAK